MKKVPTIILLVFSLVCLVSLQAHAISPEILQTLDYHEKLIEEGIYYGDISPKELRKLDKQQAKIRRAIDRLQDSYRITYKDLARIRKMQNKAENKIYESLGIRRDRQINYSNYPRRQNRSYFNNYNRRNNDRQRSRRSRNNRNYCG